MILSIIHVVPEHQYLSLAQAVEDVKQEMALLCKGVLKTNRVIICNINVTYSTITDFIIEN